MTFPVIPTIGNGRMATPIFQANTTATRTFPSLTGLTKNSGDLLIAIVVAYQASASGATFSGWTGGFTEFSDVGNSATPTMAIGAAYKFSTGSETGAITVTQATTVTGHAGMFLFSIPGAHASTLPAAGEPLTAGTGTVADPAAFNPVDWDVEDTLWISIGGSGEVTLTGSYTGMAGATNPPTNYGNSIGTGESGDVIGAIGAGVAFRQNRTASEDVGPWGSVDTSNARNCALLVAVRPAVPNPPVEGVGTGDFGFVGDALGVVEGATLGVATGVFGFVGDAAGASRVRWYVDRNIIAGSDDAAEQVGNPASTTGTDEVMDAVDDYVAFRFTDFPYQQSAPILVSQVSFTISDSDKNDAEGTWYAHDTDDGATFEAIEGGLTALPKTTASVAWTTNDLGTAGTRVTSPNLASLVQEVVNRPGWQPDNCICFIYVHNSATDKITVAMSENTTYTLEPSFHGEYFLLPIVAGVATADVVFTGTAAGVISGGPVPGLATGVFGFTGTALGIRETFGVAAGSFGFTATALGIDIQFGTATGVFGFTGTGLGMPRKVGAATGLFGFTGTATGVRRAQGTATGLFGFVGTAIGSTAGTKVGFGTGLFGFTATATGTPETFGTATGLFGFAGTGLGKPFVSGTATGLFIFTSTALGQPRTIGVAVGTFGFVGVAVVTPPPTDIGWPVIVIEEPKTVTVSDPIQAVLVVDPDPNVLVNDPDQVVMVSDPEKTVLVTDPTQSITV